MNCGFQAYRGECARSIEVYGRCTASCRFRRPAGLAGNRAAGNHRPRLHGSSRLASSAIGAAPLDPLTVAFLGRYQNRPCTFRPARLVLGSLGFLICLYPRSSGSVARRSASDRCSSSGCC